MMTLFPRKADGSYYILRGVLSYLILSAVVSGIISSFNYMWSII